MSQNFIECDREQVLLLPPSLREWLPEEHLAWFVLDAVEQMDLSGFYGVYRLDGHGRPAHEPAMMVALLVYGYAKGQRSSRVIERECVEDIAYRVIAANQVPDHTTVARFRQRHETALAGGGVADATWIAARGPPATGASLPPQAPTATTTHKPAGEPGNRGTGAPLAAQHTDVEMLLDLSDLVGVQVVAPRTGDPADRAAHRVHGSPCSSTGGSRRVAAMNMAIALGR